MQEISIFIASSRSLAYQRLLIGDAIRRWSDELEPKGYRLVMRCWEDIHPEFNGTRKQDEYNTEAIEKSQIFIVLFDNHCGSYTKEEVAYWQGLHRGKVSVVLTQAPNDEVAEYITSKKLSYSLCDDDVKVIEKLRSIVDQYIDKHPADGNLIHLPDTNIYASISDTCEGQRLSVSNTIRYVDSFAERVLKSRCRLFQKDKGKLDITDYYLSVVRQPLDIATKEEMLYGLEKTTKGGHPSAAVVYHNWKELDDEAEVKEVISRKGIFSEKNDENHRIKFNLLVWLIDQKMLDENWPKVFTISKDGKWASISEENIVPLDIIGVDGDDFLTKQINLLKIIKGIITPKIDPNTEIDNEAVETAIQESEQCIALNEFVNNVEEIAHDSSQILLAKLNRMLDSLTGKVDADSAEKYMRIAKEKVKVQQSLVNRHKGTAKDVVKSMLTLCNFAEDYTPLFCRLFNYEHFDLYYKEIFDYADVTEVEGPEIEAMRMNYANFLARNNKAEAYEFYNTALHNLENMDDGTIIYRNYFRHLYLNLGNQYHELGHKQEARQVFMLYKHKAEHWEPTSPIECLLDDVMLITARLRARPLDEDVINSLFVAFEMSEQVKGIDEKSVPWEFWDDIYVDFHNSIIATIADVLNSNLLKKEESAKLRHEFDNISGLLLSVIKDTDKLSEYHKLFFLAQVFHNIAFAESNAGRTARARKNAGKALELRRKIYRKTPTASNEAAIAQTLLLLGATFAYRGGGKHITENFINRGLAYAEESLALYAKLNSGDDLELETRVYEALLLKGTLLANSKNNEKRNSGLRLVQICKAWSDNNPDNTYKETFETEYTRYFK